MKVRDDAHDLALHVGVDLLALAHDGSDRLPERLLGRPATGASHRFVDDDGAIPCVGLEMDVRWRQRSADVSRMIRRERATGGHLQVEHLEEAEIDIRRRKAGRIVGERLSVEDGLEGPSDAGPGRIHRADDPLDVGAAFISRLIVA